MEYLAALAIIQGITEFLPISSSAHLALFPTMMGQDDQGLAIDIAVHFGSLGAVILYNLRLLMAMGVSLVTFGRRYRDLFPLTIISLVASIPLVVVGYLFSRYDIIELYLRHMMVIGCASIFFGILLALADRVPGRRQLTTLTMYDAVVIGLAQPLALIPGTSRSGICITVARMTGLNRIASVQFAMILSIPAILGASVKSASDIALEGSMAIMMNPILKAAGLAFVVALISIVLMMRLIERIGMMPFVIYRVALGLLLIALAFNV
jgi:undecaprenyl-diphosphatase